jgi:DnaK suppressor protein
MPDPNLTMEERAMTHNEMVRRMKPIRIRRREALRRSLSGERGQFNTSDERTIGDEADLALDADYGFINSQLAETESRELERIERALDRMREGSYGPCETCGGKIALARLQALPYAVTCIRCQRTAEQDQVPARVGRNWPRRENENHQDPDYRRPELMGLVV